MKKQYLLPIILFIVFLVADVILQFIFANLNAAHLFLPAIFLEITIFGCIIIYLIIKNTEKKDD